MGERNCSIDQLREVRRRWLRQVVPKRYRQLRRDGEPEEDLTRTAEDVREFAHRLIATGTGYRQTWLWARRVHISESEMD